MSWAEVKKINSDMTIPLDERMEEIDLRYRTFILSDNILFSKEYYANEDDVITLHFMPKISGYLYMGYMNVSRYNRINVFSNGTQVAYYQFTNSSSISDEYYKIGVPITANEEVIVQLTNQSANWRSTFQIRGEVRQVGYLEFIKEEIPE